jgi:hypothetical protein
MGQEMPRLFQAFLETMRTSDQIDEPMMNHMMGLLRETQSRAFASYRATVEPQLTQTRLEYLSSSLANHENTSLHPLQPIQQSGYDLPRISEQPEPNLNFNLLQIHQQRSHHGSSVADSGYAASILEPPSPPPPVNQHLSSMLLSSSPSLNDQMDFTTSPLQTMPGQTQLSTPRSAIYQPQTPTYNHSPGDIDALLSFSET